MTLPQVTGDLLNALLRIVKELGLPLLFAAILLLILPPWIAAAVYLSLPLLLVIVILLASIAVFAPAPWLVRIVTRLATWVSAWALYLSLNDRQKRLLGPFAMVEFDRYWFPAKDEDLQGLLDRKLLFQDGVIVDGGVINVRASIPRGKKFIDRFRARLRRRWVTGADDEVGKEFDRTAIEASRRASRRI